LCLFAFGWGLGRGGIFQKIFKKTYNENDFFYGIIEAMESGGNDNLTKKFCLAVFDLKTV